MNEPERPAAGPPGQHGSDRAPREYPHGTGDRNTDPEHEGRGRFHGGEQREAGTDTPPDPGPANGRR